MSTRSGRRFLPGFAARKLLLAMAVLAAALRAATTQMAVALLTAAATIPPAYLAILAARMAALVVDLAEPMADMAAMEAAAHLVRQLLDSADRAALAGAGHPAAPCRSAT